MCPGIQLFPSLLTESERTGEAGRKERGGVFYENSHGKVKKRPSCACVVMLLLDVNVCVCACGGCTVVLEVNVCVCGLYCGTGCKCVCVCRLYCGTGCKCVCVCYGCTVVLVVIVWLCWEGYFPIVFCDRIR